MKFKSNEEGRCPICNSQMIEYFGMELEDTAVYFPWHCSDCGTDGKEWYYVNFSEVRSNDDNIGEEEGVCPDCGAEIEYGTAEPDGNSLGYEYFCPECENSGREWYDLDFDSHTIDGHEDEEIELIQEGINYKDDKLNVTTAEDPEDDRAYYGKNMTKRDKVRSLDQAHRNLVRAYKDSRVSDGQAVDQISFDNLPNDDLEAYKYNKHQAKSAEKVNDTIWADEHNKTAKQFADKIRAKHKKQEEKDDRDIENLKQNIANKVADDMVKAIGADNATDMDRQNFYNNTIKSLETEKGVNSILNDYKDGTSNRDIRITTDLNTLKNKLSKSKKQEDIEDDEEENDINLEDTISLLDIALKEIPTIGVEDWGKDDELLFTADTKVMFENLKNYEEEIPKYYYDNASNDDWSNGIDSYLEEIKGVDLTNGDSDNTYNWNAPLTHDVEFTMYEADDGCYFKGSIHRAGDVRGNYTTEFLLKFVDKDDCLETLFDTCSENCYRSVTVDDVEYVVSPHFFNEYVDIWNTKTQESYDDVYCDCIDSLKEIIADNKNEE